ncbi:iron-sulfur cluster insertion protein ErpA [Candidatus Schneideria nysicola]|uniref:iron-sulfur cluster insertion protein ErpA n=1 Tax=Candidatus Schneideria nysicola TaxID=1081631 RepID=UPI001CAA41A8|nr:iron-sulfur cluster insertion protein ErpA [Candidatus Schneideria nysicola]UAJ65946.1 iron-sulfur cluster insertion protein ErpA [Candidatus Schneideria nysicola]
MKKIFQITDTAAKRIHDIIQSENKLEMKLRIYIIGGGCSGFQYRFMLDKTINEGDYIFEEKGVFLIIDPMSFQYLIGGLIDYKEELEGSRFIIKNPNAQHTCSCGLSFSV